MTATIEQLADSLLSYLQPSQVEQVKQAYFYAEQAHTGQTRRSGEPYITHPLAVASILSEMHMDHQSLMAAMLHDVIEDTGVAKQTLGTHFGDTVADLVDGVSKLKHIHFETRAIAQAENFQKMILAMAKDIRVILVKLADRLHNMRTLGVMPPDRSSRIAKETLEIYAPIALRLGMNAIRIELEERGFATLYPMRHRRIHAAVNSVRGNRKELLNQISDSLTNQLTSANIPAKVIGREKHLYSIYQKMRVKRRSFSEITDVFAFRIIVDDVDTCYRSLGCVHNLYKPVAGRFKDYIAIPKANGYQSLHTTLFGMRGVPIEIQIRTREMESMANNGIAAHWLYKADNAPAGRSHERARAWVQDLLEMQKSAGNSMEFIENVKIDLFPDEVYLFTPNGTIMEMPTGATAVDFAYAVHTDVGNTCVACRIDRRFAPLSVSLQSGQTVEIITAPGAQPNPSWLSFVLTGKARSAIRHFLKNQRRSESVELGKRLLAKAMSSLSTGIEEIDNTIVNSALVSMNYSSLDDLLEDIGLGNRMAYVIAHQLIDPNLEPTLNSSDNNALPIAIRGSEGLVISFAKCCYPIPGDPVVGHVSTGKGMVIHQESCNNLYELRDNPEKVINVVWEVEDDTSAEYRVELRIELEHHRGIIATIASSVTAGDANITKIDMAERDAKVSLINLALGVKNRVHLAQVIKRLRIIKGVSKISRRRS